MTNNSLNSTVSSNYETIMSLVGTPLSIVLSIITLAIVFQSRSVMNMCETYNLILFNLIVIVERIFYLGIYVVKLLYNEVKPNCFNTALNECITILEIFSYFTLFYYSLLQISTLSRAALILKLFNLVHTLRTFVLFETITFFLLFCDTYFFINFYRSNCQGMDYYGNEILFVFYQILLPQALIIISYTSAACYVCVTRFLKTTNQVHSMSVAKLRRFRKNFILVLKFLFLSFIFIFSCLCYLLPFTISSAIINSSIVLTILVYFSNFTFFVQPILLIYAHNILKKTLIRFMKNIFEKIFKIK